LNELSSIVPGESCACGGAFARTRFAETGGFEPPREFYPPNRLAGGCFRPLSHVSVNECRAPLDPEPFEPGRFPTAAE
jgi:hypothetical protein